VAVTSNNLSWDIYYVSGVYITYQNTLPTPTGQRGPTAAEAALPYYSRWYFYDGVQFTDLGRRS
jgi:hypothetical protein